MNTIIEQALQLSTEEKLELYYALQENLDGELDENDLTKEQWEEINQIAKQIDDGAIEKISEEEMMMFLKNRRNDL